MDVFAIICVVFGVLWFWVKISSFNKEYNNKVAIKNRINQKISEIKTNCRNYSDYTFHNALDEEVVSYIIDKDNCILYIYKWIEDKLSHTKLEIATDCELIFNDEIIQKSNTMSILGRAAVGGVLFGGVGALAGAVTGAKVSTKSLHGEATIKVYYDDINHPIDIINFSDRNVGTKYDALLRSSKNIVNYSSRDVSELASEIYSLLLACISKAAKQREQNQHRIENKRCPFCAEEIQREAVVCKYCGRDIPSEYETFYLRDRQHYLLELLKKIKNIKYNL